MKIIIVFLALLASAHAQLLAMGKTQAAVAPSTPALINFSGMPSLETTALGTKVQNTCATNAYCAPLVDPTLAGNNVIIFYKYKPASVNTADIPTVASLLSNGTATGDTYTHCGTDANDSTNHIYLGCYYMIGATTGTASVKLTWANANTNVAVATATFNGANAADVYHANNGTATTTPTAGSATSTANGDIWFHIACGTSTLTNVAAYTVGSQVGITWVGDMLDRRDACAIQHGTQTTAGALNPTLTSASNAFVSLAMSFKAGSQGTSPPAFYVKRIYHVSSASGSSNLAYQVPVESGNLIAVLPSGGSQFITAVSDTTNGTWKACNQPVSYGFVGPSDQTSSEAFFFPNSAAASLPVTLTVSGTGDTGPAVFYEMVGMDTTQTCGAATPVQDEETTGATFSAMTNYSPSASSGITLSSQSLFFNTVIGSSLGTQDCSTAGGQVINGPSFPDQNNGCSHWNFSNNLAQSLTYTRSDQVAGGQVGATSGELVSFKASGATAYPAVVKSAQNNAASSGTTIAVTSYVPYAAGDTIVAFADGLTITTGTITISDPTNGSYTCPNAVANAGGYRSVICYMKNVAATTVTITATFGTSNSQRSLMIAEVANVSTTAPLDQSSATTAETATGTPAIVTGPSLTTTSANEVLVAFHLCTGSCEQNNTSFPGQPVIPWSQGIGDTKGNISTYRAVGATGSYTSQAIDSNGNGSSDAVAMVTLKQ